MKGRSTPLSIALHLEHSIAVAGCIFKGTVLLTENTIATPNAHRVAPDIQKIELVLEGQERCVLGHADDFGKPSQNDESSVVPLIRVNHSVDLREEERKDTIFTRTSYGFQFEMKLPEHLPNSMHCAVSDDSEESFCEVSYQITAFCHLELVQEEKISFIVASEKHCIWIVARPPPPPSPKLLEVSMEEFPIMTCCIKQGYIKMGISLEDCSNVVFPHSILRVNILGKNCSSVPVHHLSAKLCEVVQWRVGQNGKQQRKTTRTLNEATILVNNKWAQQWQAVPNKQGMLSSCCCWPKEEMMSEPDGELGMVRLTWASVHNRTPKCLELQWTIPSDIRDSYEGQIIEVRHLIMVKAVTSRHWRATCPETVHLIRVQRPPIEWTEEEYNTENFQSTNNLNNGDVPSSQEWETPKNVNDEL